MAYYNGKKIISLFNCTGNGIQGTTLSGNTLTIHNGGLNPKYDVVVYDTTGLNTNSISLEGNTHTTYNILHDDLNLVIDDTEIVCNGSAQNITIAAASQDYFINYDGNNTITSPNLSPENIKAGVTILGVTGTYTGN